VIWLTWRQFRTQAVVVCGLLAAVAVALAVTGPHLVHLYDTTVKPCASHGDCAAATESFMNNDRLLQQLGQVVLYEVVSPPSTDSAAPVTPLASGRTARR
jgi:hypothetical protein